MSWLVGKDPSLNGGSGVAFSMQAPVTSGSFGAEIRLVCWGTTDGASPPLVDYGFGIMAATLTAVPVGSVQ